jgi:RNA polymerase sigma factor (sigma-70 family)
MSELRRELCDSLAGISAQQAQVVVLKDTLGYSFEEIAEATGMPVGTAKCHAHRGRNRLRERLEEREVA